MENELLNQSQAAIL